MTAGPEHADPDAVVLSVKATPEGIVILCTMPDDMPSELGITALSHALDAVASQAKRTPGGGSTVMML